MKVYLIMKNNNIKVSLIIPVYNVAPYVYRCLQSVYSQTYQNIEIIIVDDCGTDNSIQIIEDFIQTNSTLRSIKLIHHPFNKGLSAARNTGIKESTGDYLYFLDSDDEITNNCIEILVNETNTSKPDFIIADYKCIGSSVDMPPLSIKTKVLSNSVEILKSFREQQWYVMAVNKLIKREFLIANELFFNDNIIHEDILWSFMIACKANCMKVIKDKTYLYYIRENSITQSIKSENNKIYKERSNESKREIVSGMYMYCSIFNSDDRKNEIIKTFEEYKYLIFMSIVKTGIYSKKKLFNIYKDFRHLNDISNLSVFKLCSTSPKNSAKYFHYLLPEYFGFKYLISLEKINRELNTIRI